MTKGYFRITRCGMDGVQAVVADTSHIFARHTHDQFGIGLIMRGAQKSLSGRGIVEAKAGDIITVNPGEVHDGSPIGGCGRAWRMLYIDPAVLADAASDVTDGAIDTVEFSRPAMRDPACAARFRSLFHAMAGPGSGDIAIEGRENLLLLLARLIEHRRGARAPVALAGIARSIARIDDDPATPLSLADLAHISGLSQFQLVRGFARATGLTPHAYLVQRRLQAARRLIAGGATLAYAAQASGFADQSHMTRLFVRTYGLSPGLYACAMA